MLPYIRPPSQQDQQGTTSMRSKFCRYYKPSLVGTGATEALVLFSFVLLGLASGSPRGRFAARWEGGDGRVTCGHAAVAESRRTDMIAANGSSFLQEEEELECDMSVVGLGWGGAYFAYRLGVDSSFSDPKTICLFEADERVGGRALSVHALPFMEDLVIDVGAYRYTETQMLPRRLIEDALLLPTACYDWNAGSTAHCKDLTGEGGMRKVVDAYGNNRGYATAIEAMVEKLEASGARVEFGKRLVGVYRHEGRKQNIRLEFSDGTVVRTQRAFLNLPPPALSSLDGVIRKREAQDPLLAASIESPLGCGLTKAYVYYEDAWWVSRLGLVEGNFSSPPSWSGPELSGRYHDGPVKCTIGVDDLGQPLHSSYPVPFGSCTGAILAFYNWTTPYYAGLRQARETPLTVLLSDSSPDSQQALADIHKQLIDLHAKELHEAGIEPSSLAGPRALFLGSWSNTSIGGDDNDGRGMLPTILHYPDSVGPDIAMKMEASVQRPLGDDTVDLFVSNQGFGASGQHWAESALLMAERILREPPFLVPRPAWLDESYYNHAVVGNASEPNEYVKDQ